MDILDAVERGCYTLEQISETGHRLTLIGTGQVLYLRVCRSLNHCSRDDPSCHCSAISREAAVYKALAVLQGVLVPRLLLSSLSPLTSRTADNDMANDPPLAQPQAAFYIREWISEATVSLERLPSDPQIFNQGHPSTWDPQSLEEAFDSTRDILASLGALYLQSTNPHSLVQDPQGRLLLLDLRPIRFISSGST
jgi:hypothetical protein